ncbi:condensation domain-containing protein [Dactylosporangium sp. CA-233914]|uniref:condensation domain-containing protein n=1 Tax=Dactylosporangium sp. CA-233914 TaxID=3239934 RepID=UPI003D8E904E
MDTSARRVVVEFAGEGSGVEELTWGQRDVWDLMCRTGRTMNIGGTVPAAPGETVEHLAGLLRFIVGRHQALRTRLRPVQGGPPRQEVHAAGRIAVELLEAGADPDGTAEALRVRYQTTPFDPYGEWPVRMGVVCAGRTPTHVVLMYYHVLVDGFGIDAIVRDLAHLDDPGAPVAGVRPLELAARQRTPAARRQSEQALRYWERQLRRLPPRPPIATADPGSGEPRHWEVVCSSPALALAVRAVAARTGVASGPILLAAFAMALARATGAGTAVVQVVVSNRFRPGFAESVSSLRQFGICVIDVGGVPFDEVVARAFAAAIAAYKHGYFDSAQHAELLAGAARDRPDDVDLRCFLNDRRRQAPGDDTAPPPRPAEIAAARELTTVRWGGREDTYDGTFYLHLEDEPDTMTYTLWGDTHRYAPATIERCARDLEAVVLDAALTQAPARPDPRRPATVEP